MMLLPLYVHPLVDPLGWESLCQGGDRVTAIVNVHNGPGADRDEVYAVAPAYPLAKFNRPNLFELWFICGCQSLRSQTAEFFVIDKLFNRWVSSADRTTRILLQPQFAKLKLPGIKQEQTVYQNSFCS